MVEWKKLGDVCLKITDGSHNPPMGVEQSNNRMISSQNVHNGYIDFSSVRYLSDEDFEKENNRTNAEKGDVILTIVGTIGRCCVLKGNEGNITFQRSVALFKPNKVLSSSYLMQWLIFKNGYLNNQANGGAQKGIYLKQLAKLGIPVPPIEEQQRIVGILDTFTASIDNLKEQIAQRRKQYEYYRDQLLDLEGKPGVEMKTIAKVANSFTGLTYKPEHVKERGIIVLRSSNIDEDKLVFEDNVYVQMDIPDRAIVRENDILICVRNGSKRLVGKAAMINKDAEGMAFGAFMTILRSIDINSKFLFFVWQSTKVKKQYKGDEAMPIAQITAKDFQRVIIPVPSLCEQSRIVGILDTFEASIQNLEKQLKEREKQYEYYRNKLLTFE